MATVLRRRKSEVRYKRHRGQLAVGRCEFCEFTPSSKEVVRAGKYFWVVNTKFVYDMWDSAGVADHLMILPKRHIDALAQCSEPERKEFFNLIAPYETGGYSIYARSPTSTKKSVAHQHTHLIKIDNRSKRFILYIKKPHLLLMR